MMNCPTGVVLVFIFAMLLSAYRRSVRVAQPYAQLCPKAQLCVIVLVDITIPKLIRWKILAAFR